MKIDVFKELGEHFIGLWSYQAYSRSNKKPPKYLVTVCFRGKHFDTRPCLTPLAALKSGIRLLNKIS